MSLDTGTGRDVGPDVSPWGKDFVLLCFLAKFFQKLTQVRRTSGRGVPPSENRRPGGPGVQSTLGLRLPLCVRVSMVDEL